MLAVRDYLILRPPPPPAPPPAADAAAAAAAADADADADAAAAAALAGAGGEEGDERAHSVVITFPHEAVPMDLFLDSVMGSVLQVARGGTSYRSRVGGRPTGRARGDVLWVTGGAGDVLLVMGVEGDVLLVTGGDVLLATPVAGDVH